MIPLNRLRLGTVIALIIVAALTFAAIKAIDAYAVLRPVIFQSEVEGRAKEKVIDICIDLQDETVEFSTQQLYECHDTLAQNPPNWCRVGKPLNVNQALCRGKFRLIPTKEGRHEGRHPHRCKASLLYTKVFVGAAMTRTAVVPGNPVVTCVRDDVT